MFDEETGLYYLRSRYYNADWCRFINADDYLSANLFSYCCDSPIICRDLDGHYSEQIERKEDDFIDNVMRYLYSDEPEIVYCRSLGFIMGPYSAYQAKIGREIAEKYIKPLFGKEKDGTRANAFKHALWNAYMTLMLGSEVAKGIADAHEAPFVNDPTLYEGIPNYEHSEMDFYNNAVGRGLAVLYQDVIKNEDQLVALIYMYAMSDSVYYRIEDDGTVRDIQEARPPLVRRFFE